MTWTTIAQFRQTFGYSRSTVDRMLPDLRASGVAIHEGRLTRINIERFEAWTNARKTKAPAMPVQTAMVMQ